MEASKSGLLSEAAEAFGFDIDIVCLCDFSCLGSADFGARARGTFCILFFAIFVLNILGCFDFVCIVSVEFREE